MGQISIYFLTQVSFLILRYFSIIVHSYFHGYSVHRPNFASHHGALGNILLFLSILKTVDDESRKRQILIRELCCASFVLLIFLFVGQYLLLWLNLKQEAVSIAGGIVLFLISLRMIFPSEKGIMGEMPARKPFFVPLAVPLLAGTSTLSMLILLSRSQPDRIFEWLIAVLVVWGVTSLIMFSLTKLHKPLGLGDSLQWKG